MHRKTIFRLTLSNKCVQALLGFRLGCHNLPRDVGSRTALPIGHKESVASAMLANLAMSAI